MFEVFNTHTHTQSLKLLFSLFYKRIDSLIYLFPLSSWKKKSNL